MQQHEESHAPLSPSFARADDEPPQLAVGKRTLGGGGDAATIARHGVAGPGQPLPHLATLQRAFGRHDLSSVRAHIGGPAADAAGRLGAAAYATGDDIAFAAPPDLETAAHEAAHVVQQRRGVSLSGGLGEAGDSYEQNADRVAAAVVRGESAEALLDAAGASGGGASANVQRKLTVTGEGGRSFEGQEEALALRPYVAGLINQPIDQPKWATAWNIGPLVAIEQAVVGEDKDIAVDKLKGKAQRAMELAQVFGGKGLPLFESPEQVTFGDEHAEGAKGYISKMVVGLEDVLPHAVRVVLSTYDLGLTAKQEDLELEGATRIEPPKPKEGSENRRPGLNALNYGEVYFCEESKLLVVCNIRGKALMEQFGLAFKAYIHHWSNGKQKLVIDTHLKPQKSLEQEQPSTRNKENYGRLLTFFEENLEFQQATTLVFGYANAFENREDFTEVRRVSCAGWVGTLYRRTDTEKHIVVLDSDTKSSYHGEILAKNIKKLLESGAGKNICSVLVGGSAGALVPPNKTVPNHEHESPIEPSSIYTPGVIQGPDGKEVPNSLHGLGRVELPSSKHTSVISALVETPKMLDRLYKYGFQTVDMEFGYVAVVLNQVNEQRDQPISFGVACLITDYPRTSGETKLSNKEEEQKKLAKGLFVDTIRAFLDK